MNDDRLFRAMRSAGDVPEPPGRDRALARALAAIPQRRPGRKLVVAFIAAALVAIPVGVLAARGVLQNQQPQTPEPPKTLHVSPSPSESPKEEHEVEHRQTESPEPKHEEGNTTTTDGATEHETTSGGSTDDHSTDGTVDNGGTTTGEELHATPTPTPTGDGTPLPGDATPPPSGDATPASSGDSGSGSTGTTTGH